MKNAPETFMARALQLAQNGVGFVSPNPLVGAVIVKNGKIIGEGFHEKFGGPHAEVNAITDAEKKGHSVQGAEMYVTLEPCSHHGKTPPCADLIIKKKIAAVSIAAKDPNPDAAGGIEKLQKAGIRVNIGILEDVAKEQNRFFFHGIEKKRPFFLGKVAVDKNGFVTAKKGSQAKISGKESQKSVHRLRMECDAILIGAETAIIDNPLLSVRFGKKKRDPLRIILDPNERTSKTANVFRDKNYLLITTKREQMNKNSVQIGTDSNGCFDLHKISEILFQRGIRSVLVEGGPKTLEEFIQQRLLDEMIVIRSQKSIGEKGAPSFSQIHLDDWEKAEERKIGEDVHIRYRLKC